MNSTQGAAETIAALIELIVPERRQALGLHPGLDPHGYELTRALLRPLSENHPPIVVGTTSSPELGDADTLFRHRVALLGGFEPQDLGNPIDWFRAPNGDMQWTTHLHYQYWLAPLAQAWQQTRDPRYSGAVIEILVDWVRQFPLGVDTLVWGPPHALSPDVPATSEGDFKTYFGPWISLAAHARADSWTGYFQQLWDAPQMTNANVALLLQSLLVDHRLTMLNFDRWATSNQYIAIAVSLIRLARRYPDFISAPHSEAVGRERIMRCASELYYPDGAYAECSPNYSEGSLKRLFQLAAESEQSGCPLPPLLRERMRLAMRYFMLTADPAGNTPRIAKGGGSARNVVALLNRSFHDAEAAHFVDPAEGHAPAALGHLFPWVGHAAMRSGWDEAATWLFFEPGPRGSGHCDFAQLNVQLKANGDWLLTDPGYYSYSNAGEAALMAQHLRSTAAHNLALVDGHGQLALPRDTAQKGPNPAPGDYGWTETASTFSARGAYTFGFTSGETAPASGVWNGHGEIVDVIHRREVVFHKSGASVEIIDLFEGAGRHRIDLHWQCEPQAEAAAGINTASVAMPHARMQMNFDAPSELRVTVHRGEKEPLRGWFSKHYGELATAPMLRVSTEADLPLRIVTRLEIERLATSATADR